ncbi:ligand-binding sensor domain-containing protein [Flavobacterium pedocola]
MRLNYFLTLFCVFFCIASGQSQQGKFVNFTQEDGLPSNEVYDAFQDKKGSVWFATDRGIAHYDGYEFKKFEPKEGLTDITVFDFFPQEDGKVWCSTFSNKIFYFKNGETKFYTYKFNVLLEQYLKKHKYSTFFLKSIVTNAKGEVFLSNNEVLLKVDANGKVSAIKGRKTDANGKAVNDKKERYVHTWRINNEQSISYLSPEKSDFLQPYCSAMHRGIVTVSPTIKLVVTDRLVFMHKKGSQLKKISFPNHEPIEAGTYGKSLFWIGFRGKGVKIFDFEGNLKKTFLENHSVSKVMNDCFGGLWVTTIDSGVFYLAPNQITTRVFDNSGVSSLTSDADGALFVGVYNGDVYRKTSSSAFEKIHKGVINIPGQVQFFPEQNKVYCYSDNKVFTSEGEQNDKIAGVLKISDDNSKALVFSQYGVYTVLEAGKVISDTLNFRIHDISFANNKFYLGTINGVRVFEKNKVYQKNHPQLNCRIDDLDYVASKGVFYMATLGKGVLVYNPTTNSVFSINKSNGLSNDLVTEIYVEDQNTIWACTNYGLNRIRFGGPKNYTIDYITSSNGLMGNQVKDVEVVRDMIYVGTAKGLSMFSKAQFEKIFAHKKYFLGLKKLVVNNEVQNEVADNLELKHNENQVDFFLDAVSFSDNKELLYRYKLQGLDKNWRYTKERKISYEFIPSGNYKFIVQIVEGGRLLSQEKLIVPFCVNSPFWKTWWFVGLIVVLLGVLLYVFFKIRVLTYNKDIVRELLRLVMKKIKRKEKYYSFRESGKEIRVRTSEIMFVKSSGNYIDILADGKNHTVRCKISDFIDQVPDSLEFLRVHRSYIIRIDRVEQKTRKAVYIGSHEIPVGETYLEELDKIVF